jgi:hypothetical protein
MISCSIQGGSKFRPWCLWTCCWYRCTCQLLFQWAMRTIMWDMGPKTIQSAHGSSGSTQGIHVPKPWFRASDFDNFATHSFGCKSFFWVLDIQNPCRMNAIWGLLLVGLAVTMEGCSFVIWSHILANVHHVFLWTVECIFLGELHENISYCHCCYLLFEVCNCHKGQIHSFMCYKWQATIYILRYGFVCIASSLRVRA